MEFNKECFVNLNIWACDGKHANRISDYVVQKPRRTRSISKYHFQHRLHDIFEITRDSYASAIVSLSLSLACSQSLQIVWIQKISDVLPNQIRGKQDTKNQSCKHTSDFASDASEEYNRAPTISKASDQPAHMHSLIRAFASRLNIL